MQLGMGKLVTGAMAGLVALAAGGVQAADIFATFPEVNGPSFTIAGPFPQPPLAVATKTFSIPAGERVVAASISGTWGSSGDPDSTSGVTVFVDGIVVAKCTKPDPSCFSGDQGQRPWSYTFTQGDLSQLADGKATLSVVQTSEISVRLGVSTLVVQTAPPPIVPTLPPSGLAALALLLAAAGAYALARLRRA